MEIDMEKSPVVKYWHEHLEEFLAVKLRDIDELYRSKGTLGSKEHEQERKSAMEAIEGQKKEFEQRTKLSEETGMYKQFYIQNTKQNVGGKLVNTVPKESDSRLKEAWKIARELTKDLYSEVDNFYLAKCLNRKLTRKKYRAEKEKYKPQIINRIRTIKKYWKPLHYGISFNKHTSKIVKTS